MAWLPSLEPNRWHSYHHCWYGRTLIADILAAGLEKLAGAPRFLVLQPNNREDEGAWLVDHDFRIVDEAYLGRKCEKFFRDHVVEQGSRYCQPRNYALVPI